MSVASKERQLKRRIASGEIRMPSYEAVAEKLKTVASEKSEWAGIPMPVEGFPLTLEPRYPYRLNQSHGSRVCRNEDVDETAAGCYEVVNSWFCEHKGARVQVIRRPDGKHESMIVIGHNRTTMLINTLGASRGWLLDAEEKAHVKLGELVNDYQMRCYMLTGTFLESSKRSGVAYMFRKLRPTIAMSAGNGQGMKALCALCAHSIGYYAGSFAGALCPTDDVISHLVQMRGDEHYFWRICNQHHVIEPQAGV